MDNDIYRSVGGNRMNDINKKMIVFDMDGTLLNNEELIPTTTIDLIKKLKREGVIMVAASGRTLWETEIIPGLFDIVDYAITSDGSNLLDVANKKTIYNKVLNSENLKEIFDIVENKKVDFVYYTNEGEFNSRPVDKEITKVKLFFESIDLIKKYEAIINKNYSNSYKAIFMTHSNFSEHWLAVNPINADKGFGIKVLKELLNIETKNVISFGDRNNDISTFRESGLSVAMENATFEVKNNADYITLSNNELGVEKFLLTNK